MGPEADVPEGEIRCVSVNERDYALFRVGGKVYCLANKCTHLRGPLCEGLLEDHVVECPWHGSRFDIRTGQVVGPPARTPVRSYECTIANGRTWVEIP
ncbi:MAG: Rieske (2Fe-2S) protein [Methanobacteriota archaeon]